jgi:DNA-binding phage protein
MTKRAKIYQSSISEKIRSNPEYAEHFIRSAIMNHGDSLEIALANAIDQYGHAELAARIGKAASNLTRTVRSLRENGDVKLSTLRELLRGMSIGESNIDLLIMIDCNSSILNEISEPDEKAIWKEFRYEKRKIEYGT